MIVINDPQNAQHRVITSSGIQSSGEFNVFIIIIKTSLKQQLT